MTSEPDQLTLHGQLNVLRPSGEGALNAAAVAVDTLKGALTALGGVASDSTTSKAPLTWLIRAVHTRPEADPIGGLTGGVFATVQWEIAVRDFTHLQAVQAIVSDPHLHQVHHPQWRLDWDNPAWSLVRAEAVGDAFRRARQYSSALGSELVSLEHLADAGLLGGVGGWAAGPRMAFATSGAPLTGPSLDPVPQEVSAVVEARFRIAPVDLTRLGPGT